MSEHQLHCACVAVLTRERDELLKRDALQQAALRVIAAGTDPAHWEAPDGVLDLATIRNVRKASADLLASVGGDETAREKGLREQRDELHAALEALVAGVEDSVLRFLDSHELSLRADMDVIVRARVERARAALAKAGAK